MRAYVWLGEGAVDPVFGEPWSTDSSFRMRRGKFYFDRNAINPRTGIGGGWRRSVIRTSAVIGGGLARSVNRELWEVELSGDVEFLQPFRWTPPDVLSARRGKLIRRVDAWDSEAPRLARRSLLTASERLADELESHTDALTGGDLNVAGRLKSGIESLREVARAGESGLVPEDVRRAAGEIAGSMSAGTAGSEFERSSAAARFERAARALEKATIQLGESASAAAGAALHARYEAAAAGAFTRTIQGMGSRGNPEANRAESAARWQEVKAASAELAGRLALSPPDPAEVDEVPVKVPVPATAQLAGFFLCVFGLTALAIVIGFLIAAGSPDAVEEEFELKPIVQAALVAGGIALLILCALVVRGSRAVRRRRWAGLFEA